MKKFLTQTAFLLALFSSLLVGQAHAQGQQKHGDYTVYHTIFASTFLQPEIAAAYDLVRGENIFLVNISVNAAGEKYGQKVTLKGTATNLMQQQKQLDFKEIIEGEAAYYIAPIRVKGQEVLHFALDIQTAPDELPFTAKFTQKLVSE